jgi:hypothetical protein
LIENDNNTEGNDGNSSTYSKHQYIDTMDAGVIALVRLEIIFLCKAKGKKNLSVAEITMTIVSLKLFFCSSICPDSWRVFSLAIDSITLDNI